MKSKVKSGNENKPWVSNYPPLKEWLDRHEARCMWQLPYGDKRDPAAYVECWQFPNGRQAIVVVWGNRNGWEVYTPCGSRGVDETIIDAEHRLELRGTSPSNGGVREPYPDEPGPWNE